jgi:hypothetical protein
MSDRDRRHHARRAVRHLAHIATGLGLPLECQVNDVSETGARIAASFPKAAPQEFLLLLKVDLLRWCRVIWRSDHEIGVEFVEPPHSLADAGRTPPPL